MSATGVSRKLVGQRVRNRQIEWLEMLASYESNPKFDLNELMNQWYDWSPERSSYALDVYTSTEAEQLSRVAITVGEFCKATPSTIYDEAAELVKPEWKKLVLAGRAALAELHLRGRLSDDS